MSPINQTACLWVVGGGWRKHTEAQQEHATPHRTQSTVCTYKDAQT